jgi:hypothetical protein
MNIIGNIKIDPLKHKNFMIFCLMTIITTNPPFAVSFFQCYNKVQFSARNTANQYQFGLNVTLKLQLSQLNLDNYKFGEGNYSNFINK